MPTTLIDLERALQRYGDELYRLALLLTPDEASAAALLATTARRLASSPIETFDEPTLFTTLAAALPPERKRWRRQELPSWTRPPLAAADTGPLLAQIARLPRAQRLALGLAMLPGLELHQATPIFQGDEVEARRTLRDALLALAPLAMPDLVVADLGLEDAPVKCQPTRTALALGAGQVHEDPAVRGHLALCDSCRAAEEAWQQLYGEVEHALRSALRDRRLPDAMAAQMRAAINPEPAPGLETLIADPRVRLGLVAFVVLALIALLVLPRRPATNLGDSTIGEGAVSARELVQRALDNLYAPPPGSGVWHGRWEMRWAFPGNTYAPLVGELWIDPTTRRHRVQFVHQSGGGPYEFELGDGQRDLWYATTATYGPSLYPLIFDQNHTHVHLQLPTDQQDRMLAERLSSGAWGLAAIYLRQAQAAGELHSWGRQRAPDGTLVEVIGFRGVSPLALPPDAPDATASQATVLLTIEPRSGTLREVRELLGQAGGEQTGRLIWRFVSGEQVTDSVEIVRVFDRAQAWNGIGDFYEQDGVADPALPLVPAAAIIRLAQEFQIPGEHWLPTRVPTGTLRAAFFSRDWQPGMLEGTLFATNLTSVYIGAGRRLVVWEEPDSGNSDVPPADERVVVNGKPFGLHATTAQGYRATMLRPPSFRGNASIVWVSAFGYTRAELLDILGTLDQPTIATYYALARTFIGPLPADPAAFEALLQALKPAPSPSGTVRHFVERVFTRQSPQLDPLPDPYHLPPYRGWPEQVLIDNWERTNALSGTVDLDATTKGSDGTIYARQYLGPTEVWYYDAKTSAVNRFRRDMLTLENQTNTEIAAVLKMIACGKGQLTTLPDGTRVVSNSVVLGQPSDLPSDSCRNSNAEYLLRSQQENPARSDAPYLLDVAGQPITTWIYLGASERAIRMETRAGTGRDGVLINSWELVSDERVPASQVPAQTFDESPPQALTVGDYTDLLPQEPVIEAPHEVPLSETLQLIATPVLIIPTDQQVELARIEAGTPSISSTVELRDPVDFALDAVRHGFALRFTYTLSDEAGLQNMRVYEGPADQIGAYLRLRGPVWDQSAPISLDIAGRTHTGWRVTTQGFANWILVEIDGTLLVLEDNTPQQRAAIARLQRLK